MSINKDTGFKLNEKEADLILTEIQSKICYWKDEISHGSINRTFIRKKNIKSRFDGMLNSEVLSGKKELTFVFYSDSDKCYFPINTSYYELIEDGWEEESVDVNKLFKEWVQDTSEDLDDESVCYPDLRQKAIEEPIELPYNYEQTPDYLDTVEWIKKGYCPCGDSNPETQAACSTNGCPMYRCESRKDKKNE